MKITIFSVFLKYHEKWWTRLKLCIGITFILKTNLFGFPVSFINNNAIIYDSYSSHFVLMWIHTHFRKVYFVYYNGALETFKKSKSISPLFIIGKSLCFLIANANRPFLAFFTKIILLINFCYNGWMKNCARNILYTPPCDTIRRYNLHS